MKATAKLLVAALAVAGLAFTAEAQAQSRGTHGFNGHGGSWSHGGGHFGGFRGTRVFIGAPLLIGGWGWPYYWPYNYDYYGYPGSTVIYRDVERYPQSYVDQPGEIMPSTEVRRGDGAPSQGPLYMNYCESAKAYFPKVSTCPEGWRLATPAR